MRRTAANESRLAMMTDKLVRVSEPLFITLVASEGAQDSSL